MRGGGGLATTWRRCQTTIRHHPPSPFHSLAVYIIPSWLQSILRWANQITQTERERESITGPALYTRYPDKLQIPTMSVIRRMHIYSEHNAAPFSPSFFSLYNFCITPLRGKSWTERTTTVTIKKKPLDDRARQLNICSSPSFFLRAAVHSHAPMYAARRREPCQVQSQFWPFFDLFLGLSLGVFRP